MRKGDDSAGDELTFTRRAEGVEGTTCMDCLVELFVHERIKTIPERQLQTVGMTVSL